MVNQSFSEYRFGGQNNADPRAARRGAGGGGGGGTLAQVREERKKLMDLKRQNDQRRRKELEASNSNGGEAAAGDQLALGLFVFSGKMPPGAASLKNLSTIITNKVLENSGKSIKIGQLDYKLIEVIGRDARFKKLFSITSEYGLSFNRRQELPSNTVFDFRIKISDGKVSKSGIVTFFVKTGKVLVKGGYLDCTSSNEWSGLSSQPHNLFASLWKMYGFSASTLPPIKRENTVASMRLGKKFNEKDLMRNLYGKNTTGNLEIVRKSKARAVTKTYFKFQGTPHHVSITRRGVIQISFKGEVGRTELAKVLAKIKQFPKRFSKYFGGTVKYQPARAPINRRQNGGPAPNLTRRGTTCPMGQRPKPYGFTGKCPPGMYVRPNPQQQPCCYKIPKNPAAYRNKLVLSYKTAQARIPNQVSEIFGLNANMRKNSPASKNDPDIKIYRTVTRVRTAQGNMVNVNNIRIGSRQCLRYTKEKLLDILERLGHSTAKAEKKSKQEICKLIKDLADDTPLNNTINKYIPTFTWKGKPTQLTLKSGGLLMIGRRECASFSRDDMLSVCSSLSIQVNKAQVTRKEMCRLIEQKRKGMRNVNINRQINKNIKNKLNRENAVVAKRSRNKEAAGVRRDQVLYQMFSTRIEPFVLKYEPEGARATIPTKAKFLGDFRTSVNLELTRPVNNINARGWKKSFDNWLKQYVDQYRTVYTNKFKNQRANKLANEAMRKKLARNKAKREIKFTMEEANRDLKKFRDSKINKNLRPFFNKKLPEFSKQMVNFVTLPAQSNNVTKASRRAGWFSYNQSAGGPMREYLEKVVSRLPPKYTGNNIRQTYTLNNKYKVVLGPKVKFERL